MLEANRIVLEAMPDERANGRLEGWRRQPHRGASVSSARASCCVDSLVRGPVVIGAGTRLENAFVGPYTSIGERCRLARCEIENSIVLVGRGDPRHSAAHRRLAGRPQRQAGPSRPHCKPKAYRFMVGDNSEVGIT